MKYNELGQCIFYYENCIDFSDKIIDHAQSDTFNWKINNENAIDWSVEKKILGYDEYPLIFSFHKPLEVITIGKKIFDYGSHYAKKNLFTTEDIAECFIRRYSKEESFLEIESPDQNIPSSRAVGITFLKDIDEGGDLHFNKLGISVKPVAGSMLFFPSSFAYSFKINRPKKEKNFLIISHFV